MPSDLEPTRPGGPAPVRRSRHLLDPDDLRRSHQRSQSSPESLTHVQRWVMSVLAVTTVLHLAAGLVVAAVLMESLTDGARVGLCAIAGVIGMIGIALGLLIHQRSPVTGWLVLGLLPALVGLVLVLS